MKSWLAGIAILLAAPPPPPTAARAPRDVVEKVAKLRATLKSLDPSVAKAAEESAGAVRMSTQCPDGGTVSWTTTTSTSGKTTTKNVAVTYAACAAGGSTATGAMTHLAVVEQAAGVTTATLTLNGTVDHTGPTYSATFVFQNVIIRKVVAADGTTTTTVSGSYTIGGMTYAVDKSMTDSFGTF